jgi:hypothetical protein
MLLMVCSQWPAHTPTHLLHVPWHPSLPAEFKEGRHIHDQHACSRSLSSGGRAGTTGIQVLKHQKHPSLLLIEEVSQRLHAQGPKLRHVPGALPCTV